MRLRPEEAWKVDGETDDAPSTAPVEALAPGDVMGPAGRGGAC